MSLPRILVGADVGGSKTAVVVCQGDRILARAEGPGAAVRPERTLAAAATISDVIRRALGLAGQLRCDVLVVGAAGAGRETEQEELRQALRGEGFASQIVVTTDIAVALEAAFGQAPGIVVTSGTGSIAVARNGTGRVYRCGGYGWQMGDEGSGYAIGRGALGAVSRAADERSPKTDLTAAILAATRCENFDGLVRWASKASTTEVAQLAPMVLDVAAQGDTVAQGIADYAARELIQLVLHLAPFFEPGVPIAVATTGGLLTPGRPLHATLKTRLEEDPRIRVRTEPVDPPMGAVKLAERVE